MVTKDGFGKMMLKPDPEQRIAFGEMEVMERALQRGGEARCGRGF